MRLRLWLGHVTLDVLVAGFAGRLGWGVDEVEHAGLEGLRRGLRHPGFGGVIEIACGAVDPAVRVQLAGHPSTTAGPGPARQRDGHRCATDTGRQTLPRSLNQEGARAIYEDHPLGAPAAGILYKVRLQHGHRPRPVGHPRHRALRSHSAHPID